MPFFCWFCTAFCTVCPVILHLFFASALNEHVSRNLGRCNFAILFSKIVDGLTEVLNHKLTME